MAIWSGLGMNYGQQVSAVSYDTTQIESDLTFLKSQGISRLRIAAPPYDGNATTIANCQDLVIRALQHGFYVVWGFSTSGTVTATIWSAFKTYVTGTFVPWAIANSLSELMISNEIDFRADGTTLTAATVRSDVRTLAATIKTAGYTGVVSYCTTILGAIRDPWIAEGIGASLDLIGWNSYDTLANFSLSTRNAAVVTAFGAKTYMSEFGSQGGGYPDFNDENLFASDTLSRITNMQSAGLGTGYFFCYRDNGFGLGANTFGLVQTNGVAHCVRGAILNTPGQKIFSAFAI